MAEDRENLLAQLNLVTKVLFENKLLHRVRTVPDVKVQTGDGPRTPEQVAWFLENDRWEDDVVSYCGTDFCTSHVNLGDAEAARMEAKDDEVLELVQRTSVTLADLYRKGRAKGVIAARSAYR
jgi:hypothetical protein